MVRKPPELPLTSAANAVTMLSSRLPRHRLGRFHHGGTRPHRPVPPTILEAFGRPGRRLAATTAAGDTSLELERVATVAGAVRRTLEAHFDCVLIDGDAPPDWLRDAFRLD